MSATPEAGAARAARPVPLRNAVRVWALIGLTSFGGPAGQIALMHRVLVEERRWISERRFLHALNYCMLLPGPEAQQLAVYIGWLLHRVVGGVIAGVLFVLPGFVAILGLSVAYATLGDVTAVQGLFFGLQAAVVAVVAEAVLRIGRRALKTPAMVALAAAAFVAIFFLLVPFPAIVAGAAVVGLLLSRIRPTWAAGGGHGGGEAQPDLGPVINDGASESDPAMARSALRAAAGCALLWVIPVLALLSLVGTTSVFTQEALLFSKTAAVTFGGAYAVLAYVGQQAVMTYGWLRPAEMLTGLGLAETTPGPLIMVVQFVGFLAAYRNPGALDPLVAGLLGSLVTVWVTFVPCFLFIFLGAPAIERLRGNRLLGAALGAITAAVVGVILNLAVWFAIHTVFDVVGEVRVAGVRLLVPQWHTLDVPALALAAVAAVAIFRLRLGVMRTLGLSAAVGLVLALAGLT